MKDTTEPNWFSIAIADVLTDVLETYHQESHSASVDDARELSFKIHAATQLRSMVTDCPTDGPDRLLRWLHDWSFRYSSARTDG